MAEGGSGSSPEFIYVARAEAVGPMDRVRNGIVDFVKSQRPSEHKRRTMEKFDWLTDHLDPTSQEILKKIRPPVEKAAGAHAVLLTSTEIALGVAAAGGTLYFVGKEGRKILPGVKANFISPEGRNALWKKGTGVARKVGAEVAEITSKAYDNAKAEVVKLLGTTLGIGAGAALTNRFTKEKSTDASKGKKLEETPEERARVVLYERQVALVNKIANLDSLVTVEEPTPPYNRLNRIGIYDSPDGKPHFAVRVTKQGGLIEIDHTYLDLTTHETGYGLMSLDTNENRLRVLDGYNQKKSFPLVDVQEMGDVWLNDGTVNMRNAFDHLKGYKTEPIAPSDYSKFTEFFNGNPKLNRTKTDALAARIKHLRSG